MHPYSLQELTLRAPVSGFCASGNKHEETVCVGDSGGPVIWIDRKDQNKEYLIGTPSASHHCGKKPSTTPNIFAAIPGKVGEWIYEKIKKDHVAICT